MNKPIFCIVGKSGVGKSTILDAVLERIYQLELDVSKMTYHTTRDRRSDESDNEYKFVSRDKAKEELEDAIEIRSYQKYDSTVIYYTSKQDIETESRALICTASLDQFISYYNNLDNIYLIHLYCNMKTRLLRTISRSGTDNEIYEVCRRTLEEDNEYNKINDLNIPKEKIISLSNNMESDIEDNVSKIIEFIKNSIENDSSTYK